MALSNITHAAATIHSELAYPHELPPLELHYLRTQIASDWRMGREIPPRWILGTVHKKQNGDEIVPSIRLPF
jgi:hypothetical protein